jgi:hypothetical protein
MQRKGRKMTRRKYRGKANPGINQTGRGRRT